MQPKKLIRKVICTGLCAIVGFVGLGFGQASITPAASAASAYETEVKYGVNMRTKPSMSGHKIRLLHRGEDVHVIQKVNKYWLKIKLKSGTIGYISASAKYTNYRGQAAQPAQPAQPAQAATPVSSSSAKADKVIDLAKSYMGRVSYDYGTRNPSRLIFDCSSFTQFIFAKVGVELKWGTRSQKLQGSYVSKSNLRKGDLIFFDTIGSNNGAINHVGIYMGNGQFIHNTPSKDGLSINSLTTGWWPSHYVSARRVL